MIPAPRSGDIGEPKRHIELEPFPEEQPLEEPSIQPVEEPVPA